MNLTERLTELVAACFTGIWIESHEHHDAIIEIAQLCRDKEWSLANWDIDQGLTLNGGATASDASDPLAADSIIEFDGVAGRNGDPRYEQPASLHHLHRNHAGCTATTGSR